jgi:hypothetical protein
MNSCPIFFCDLLEDKIVYIPGVPELPHDILITYSGVKIKTKFERINVEGRRVFKW